MYFFDRNPAYDTHTLFIDDHVQRVTYAQWHTHAAALRHIMRPRSLALILCHNTIGSALAYLACLQNRIVPLLLDGAMDATLQAHMLQTYRPNYIFQLHQLPSNTTPLYTLADYTLYEYSSSPATLYDELALLLTTSGSTGSPKLVTGDMAYYDEDGYFYITGRKKRFLKIMGKRVNLDEIEQLIKTAFPTMDAACVGEDDALHIFVTTTPSLAQEVDTYITEKTNLYPSCVTCQAIAQIPQNSSGKTQYTQLRSML